MLEMVVGMVFIFSIYGECNYFFCKECSLFDFGLGDGVMDVEYLVVLMG